MHAKNLAREGLTRQDKERYNYLYLMIEGCLEMEKESEIVLRLSLQLLLKFLYGFVSVTMAYTNQMS